MMWGQKGRRIHLKFVSKLIRCVSHSPLWVFFLMTFFFKSRKLTHQPTFCMQLFLLLFFQHPKGLLCWYIFLFWKYTNFLFIYIWKTCWNEDLLHVWNIWVITVIPFECHVHLNISFSSAPCFLISFNCPLYKINHFGLTSAIISF